MVIWPTGPLLSPKLEAVAGLRAPLFVGSTHQGAVHVVRWSPSGRWLATGGEDGVVLIWAKQPGGPIALGSSAGVSEHWMPCGLLKGHSLVVRDVSWHPSERYLASASFDARVMVWPLPWCGDNANDTAITNRNTSSTDKPVELKGRSKGKAPPANTAASTAASSSSVAPRVLTQPLLALPDHENFVQSVSWDPFGRYLATFGEDRRLFLWRARGFEQAKKAPAAADVDDSDGVDDDDSSDSDASDEDSDRGRSKSRRHKRRRKDSSSRDRQRSRGGRGKSRSRAKARAHGQVDAQLATEKAASAPAQPQPSLELEAELDSPFKECAGTAVVRRISWSPDGTCLGACYALADDNSGFSAPLIGRPQLDVSAHLIGHAMPPLLTRFAPALMTAAPAGPAPGSMAAASSDAAAIAAARKRGNTASGSDGAAAASSSVGPLLAVGAVDGSFSIWQPPSKPHDAGISASSASSVGGGLRPSAAVNGAFTAPISDAAWGLANLQQASQRKAGDGAGAAPFLLLSSLDGSIAVLTFEPADIGAAAPADASVVAVARVYGIDVEGVEDAAEQEAAAAADRDAPSDRRDGKKRPRGSSRSGKSRRRDDSSRDNDAFGGLFSSIFPSTNKSAETASAEPAHETDVITAVDLLRWYRRYVVPWQGHAKEFRFGSTGLASSSSAASSWISVEPPRVIAAALSQMSSSLLSPSGIAPALFASSCSSSSSSSTVASSSSSSAVPVSDALDIQSRQKEKVLAGGRRKITPVLLTGSELFTVPVPVPAPPAAAPAAAAASAIYGANSIHDAAPAAIWPASNASGPSTAALDVAAPQPAVDEAPEAAVNGATVDAPSSTNATTAALDAGGAPVTSTGAAAVTSAANGAVSLSDLFGGSSALELILGKKVAPMTTAAAPAEPAVPKDAASACSATTTASVPAAAATSGSVAMPAAAPGTSSSLALSAAPAPSLAPSAIFLPRTSFADLPSDYLTSIRLSTWLSKRDAAALRRQALAAVPDAGEGDEVTRRAGGHASNPLAGLFGSLLGGASAGSKAAGYEKRKQSCSSAPNLQHQLGQMLSVGLGMFALPLFGSLLPQLQALQTSQLQLSVGALPAAAPSSSSSSAAASQPGPSKRPRYVASPAASSAAAAAAIDDATEAAGPSFAAAGMTAPGSALTSRTAFWTPLTSDLTVTSEAASASHGRPYASSSASDTADGDVIMADKPLRTTLESEGRLRRSFGTSVSSMFLLPPPHRLPRLTVSADVTIGSHTDKSSPYQLSVSAGECMTMDPRKGGAAGGRYLTAGPKASAVTSSSGLSPPATNRSGRVDAWAAQMVAGHAVVWEGPVSTPAAVIAVFPLYVASPEAANGASPSDGINSASSNSRGNDSSVQSLSVVGCEDGTLHLFDSATGARWLAPMVVGGGPVKHLCVAQADNSEGGTSCRLIAVTCDGRLRQWLIKPLASAAAAGGPFSHCATCEQSLLLTDVLSSAAASAGGGVEVARVGISLEVDSAASPDVVLLQSSDAAPSSSAAPATFAYRYDPLAQSWTAR